MESSADQKNKRSFHHSKLYQLLTWQNILHSSLAFLAVNVFFYFYAVLGNTLINLVCKSLLMLIAFKVATRFTKKDMTDDEKEYDYEILSEEAIQELYIVLYVVLNNVVQYVRDIIQLKNQRRSLVRTFVFLEVSVVTKFIGDKFTLWLIVLSLFIVPIWIEKKKEKRGGESGGKVKQILTGVKNKVFSKIPKYSDLQTNLE